MDPRSVFWTAALADLSLVLLLALLGLRQIRRGAWRAHRRCMLSAAALIGIFLAAYLLKVQWLGHENVAAWSPGLVLVLRIHELGIAAMLGGGLYAGWRAFRFRHSLPDGPLLRADPAASGLRLSHRWAGRVAVAGAALAWATALRLLAEITSSG